MIIKVERHSVLGEYPLYIHSAYHGGNFHDYYQSTHKVSSAFVKNYLTHKLGVKDITSVYSDVYFSRNECKEYDSTL